MAFDEKKKPRLYSDLFKCSEKEDENIVMSSSSTSGSGSSSSGFSTPLYSDLESDGGDFIAELTRQMAECMLQEEEEEEDDDDTISVESSHVKNKEQMSCVVDYGAINNFKSGTAWARDRQTPSIQVYELKNQPPMSKQGQFCRGRRVKGAESTQQKKQQHHMQYRGREMGKKGQSGSGMQAVFLGGSGSASGLPGTGVFFPRVTSDPAQLKKKSGCSIVLMPTRVLQALELHFNQRHNSAVPPLSDGSHKDESTTSKGHPQLEKMSANSDEMQLPQEWTY